MFEASTWSLQVRRVKPISKVSPNGSKSNLSFSFYYGIYSRQYALNFYGRDYVFSKELIAEKWYKVELLLFPGSILIFPDLKIWFRWKLRKSRKDTTIAVFKHGGRMSRSLPTFYPVEIMIPALICTLLEITHRSSMVKSEIFLSLTNKQSSFHWIQFFYF